MLLDTDMILAPQNLDIEELELDTTYADHILETVALSFDEDVDWEDDDEDEDDDYLLDDEDEDDWEDDEDDEEEDDDWEDDDEGWDDEDEDEW